MSDNAIAELERLLRDEREAIRGLKAEQVLSYAGRKEALVRALQAEGHLSEQDTAGLRALVPALRHNSVLLAHARDVLRDAIAAASADGTPLTLPTDRHLLTVPTQGRSGAAPARILSVRG
jgi:hypothetical protein